jgi:glucose-6-phosphate isomerase
MQITSINAQSSYQGTVSRISVEHVVPRIWAGDHTLWSSSPRDIANRLGWLHLPNAMISHMPRIRRFGDSVREDGFTHAVLLGMGGSSLAPDVLARVFGTRKGYPELHVLDSTHPGAVQNVADDTLDKKTLFIVATKSGTTTETLSLYRYFSLRMTEMLGADCAGERFIAITDPDSPLVKWASQLTLREIFLNDPNLGGRYAALSLFGLVPAAVLGLDVEAFLRTAQTMSEQCSPTIAAEDHPAVQLGSALGTWAQEGRDKATFFLSKPIEALGDWIEQIIAESTGKEGKGIVPVLEASLGIAPSYGKDRAFIILSVDDDPVMRSIESQLVDWGQPVIRIDIRNTSELAEQFYLWEFATTIACHVLGVHPFNQPNVEATKQWSRVMTDEFRQTGKRPLSAQVPLDGRVLSEFLDSLRPGDYVGIHAYLPPSEDLTAALQTLQATIRDRYSIAVTVGYGPRFLHSTGQLHKGDRGNGHFIQILPEDMPSIPIPDSAGSPDSSLSFDALTMAQAVGDRRALEEAKRPVITLAAPAPHEVHLLALSSCL